MSVDACRAASISLKDRHLAHALLLGERFDPSQWVGVAIVLVAVSLTLLRVERPVAALAAGR